MKKILSAALAILLVSLGLYLGAQQLDSSSGGSASSKKDLIIYNWGDYIDPDLITKFEKQTGYHVIYETFDSNEAMYTKIKQGGTAYDLAVPSDYMITKLRQDHLEIAAVGNWSAQLAQAGDSFASFAKPPAPPEGAPAPLLAHPNAVLQFVQKRMQIDPALAIRQIEDFCPAFAQGSGSFGDLRHRLSGADQQDIAYLQQTGSG